MVLVMTENQVPEEYLLFLDDLRDSGATNMFGAAPYLQEMFPELGRREARNVLSHWMRTFGERHADD
jgi:hypothetical protein